MTEKTTLKRLELSVSPSIVTTYLIGIVTLIMLATIFSDNLNLPRDLNRFLNVGSEKSLPTWYSSIALLFCALLLGIIAQFKKHAKDAFAKHWSLLAIIFALLSLDEIATIHELASIPMREALGATGVFYFAWVIPAGVLVILLGLFFLRFVQHLDKKTRILFIVSGFVFLSGAIAIEMLAASLYEDYQAGLRSVIAYEKVTELEEFFEMGGIVLFIYTLLAYIRKTFKGIDIRFDVD